MRTANVHEAKSQLSKLIDAALRGEEVVIARNGVPAVTLVPVRITIAPRQPGRLKGEAVELDPRWWHADEEIGRLFEEGDPDRPDPLLG